MDRAELNAAVDALLQRIEVIRFDDYYAGMQGLRDFKSLAHQASHLVQQFTTEHVDEIGDDFEAMRKYKRRDLKAQHFNSAIRGLRADVESMKRG